MKKKLASAGIVAVLSCSMAFASLAGWEKDGEKDIYRFDSGSLARNQIVDIDGTRYGFDAEAHMMTGWQTVEGNWYYFEPENGAIAMGWKQVDGAWYYLNPEKGGAMHTSWLNVGPKRYYLKENGVMAVGSFDAGGFCYYAEPNGELKRNSFAEEGNVTIRYDADGKKYYRNDENRAANRGGGDDIWLPVLPGTALDHQRSQVQERNLEYIQEKQDELYETYKKNVMNLNSKARARKRTEWEENVKRDLKHLYAEDAEIQEFIRAVESGNYGRDDYDYYDYDHDYDHDYDYDYDHDHYYDD